MTASKAFCSSALVIVLSLTVVGSSDVSSASAGAGTIKVSYSPALTSVNRSTTVLVLSPNSVRGLYPIPYAKYPAYGTLIFGFGHGFVLSGVQSLVGGSASGSGWLGMCTLSHGCWNAFGNVSFTRTKQTLQVVYNGKYLADGKAISVTLKGVQVSTSGTTNYTAVVY